MRLEALGSLHHLDGRQVPLSAWTLALGQEGMRGLYLATLSEVHLAMSHLEAAGHQDVPLLIDTLASEDPLINPEQSPRPAASFPTPQAENAPVVFHENSRTLILENGIVRCEIDKAKGTLISIQKSGDGRNLFGEKGAWYGTFPWTLPRGMGVPPFVETSAYIAYQTEDLVEAVIKLRLDKPQPLAQEQHDVIRRGVSGVYQFAVFSKPAESTPEPSAIFDYGRFFPEDVHFVVGESDPARD
ncbi:MAG: Rhamnogalacturonate lyase family [Verrucomicrobiota bacterium]|jgi:hypothetical protein